MKVLLLLFANPLTYSFSLIFDLLSLFSAFCESLIFFNVYIAFPLMSDSEMLKYAYAELEESRGAIQVLILAYIIWFYPLFSYSTYGRMIFQSAKKLYENILGVSTNSLAHIQVSTLKFQNLGLLTLM